MDILVPCNQKDFIQTSGCAVKKKKPQPRVTKKELALYQEGLFEEWCGEAAQEDRFWRIHAKMLKRPDLMETLKDK